MIVFRQHCYSILDRIKESLYEAGGFALAGFILSSPIRLFGKVGKGINLTISALFAILGAGIGYNASKFEEKINKDAEDTIRELEELSKTPEGYKKLSKEWDVNKSNIIKNPENQPINSKVIISKWNTAINQSNWSGKPGEDFFKWVVNTEKFQKKYFKLWMDIVSFNPDTKSFSPKLDLHKIIFFLLFLEPDEYIDSSYSEWYENIFARSRFNESDHYYIIYDYMTNEYNNDLGSTGAHGVSIQKCLQEYTGSILKSIIKSESYTIEEKKSISNFVVIYNRTVLV